MEGLGPRKRPLPAAHCAASAPSLVHFLILTLPLRTIAVLILRAKRMATCETQVAAEERAWTCGSTSTSSYPSIHHPPHSSSSYPGHACTVSPILLPHHQPYQLCLVNAMG